MYGTLMVQYRRAARRLFLLDYDGTLVGFWPRPEQARPTAQVYDVLQRLCADPKNTVVIVSGRDRQSLDDWLGRLPITLIAEHGFFIKEPGGDWRQAGPVSEAWKRVVRPIMQTATDAVPASFIEEKTSALVWHFRAAEPAIAERYGKKLWEQLAPLIHIYDVQLLPGKHIIEVRQMITDKGVSVQELLGCAHWDFVLAAGDDTTDEEMFAAVPKSGYTFKVGAGATVARDRCASPEEFVRLLEQCAIVSV